MKPLGWKLNPEWRDHYDRVERERLERQIAIKKLEHMLAMDQAALDRSMNRLKMPKPLTTNWEWA